MVKRTYGAEVASVCAFKYVHRPGPHEAGTDLKLYYCGMEDCAPGHSWGPGLKDHYKIHYVHRGRGVYRTPWQTYELSAGYGFLVSPDTVSSYQADLDEPWTYSWAAFNGVQAKHYLQRARLSPEQPVFECRRPEVIEGCLQRMFEAGRSSPSRDMKLLGALYDFLSVLTDEAYEEGDMPPEAFVPMRDRYVKQALEFIETNYSRNFTIEELAQSIGLGRKYLSRLFKEALGVSPQHFLLRYRMDKASELMSNGELSIGQIAYSVGYKDQLLFSRMFKKMKGLAPSHYRNR